MTVSSWEREYENAENHFYKNVEPDGPAQAINQSL
jgi:hypothetical protein